MKKVQSLDDLGLNVLSTMEERNIVGGQPTPPTPPTPPDQKQQQQQQQQQQQAIQ